MTKPVVAITGGAMGIGLELARRLAPTHRVALLDIDFPKARNAAAVIQYCSGGFSKYLRPFRRGVMKSPVTAISRAISA